MHNVLQLDSDYDFVPRLTLGDEPVKVVDQVKILGHTFTHDLDTKTNTALMVEKARGQMYNVIRLANMKASEETMIHALNTYIVPLLELSVPVWGPRITKHEINDIEGVIRTALKIIFQDYYKSYRCALNRAGMLSMAARREKIIKKFAIRCFFSDKFHEWFQKVDPTRPNRSGHLVKQPICRLDRHKNSLINYLVDVINANAEEIRAMESKRVQCPHCPSSIVKQILLDDGSHIDYHTASFSKWDDLLGHIRAKHDNLVHPCTECDSEWMDRENLLDHVKHTHRPQAQCDVCQMTMATQDQMKKHMKRHPEKNPCQHCSFMAASDESLKRHMILAHEVKLVQCPNCDHQFTGRGRLWRHLKAHQCVSTKRPCHGQLDPHALPFYPSADYQLSPASGDYYPMAPQCQPSVDHLATPASRQVLALTYHPSGEPSTTLAPGDYPVGCVEKCKSYF